MIIYESLHQIYKVEFGCIATRFDERLLHHRAQVCMITDSFTSWIRYWMQLLSTGQDAHGTSIKLADNTLRNSKPATRYL